MSTYPHSCHEHCHVTASRVKTPDERACVCGSLQCSPQRPHSGVGRTRPSSSCTLRRSSPCHGSEEAGHTRRVQVRLAGKKSLRYHTASTSLLWAMKIRGKLHLGDIFGGKKADSQLTEGMQQSAHMAPQSMLYRGGFLHCPVLSRRWQWPVRLTGTRKGKMENPGPRPLQSLE